jgi:hypothetical protein
MGTLSDNVYYRGIALRQETIVDSRYSGRVNYYNKETDHVAAGGLAYSVDETGEIADYADANMQAGEYFTDTDLENFRMQSMRFAQEFNPDRFYAVYDYKSSSSSQAQKISNRAILAGIKNLDSTSIHTVSARETGAIVYSYDNYSDKTFENLTPEDFDSSRCRKVQLQNGQSIKKGKPVYRVVSDVNWSVAVLAENKETAKRLEEEEYVEVRFLKNNYTSWAHVSTREDKEGNAYIDLHFSNSMEAFCTDRFVDIEILSSEKKGLKVPNSSITKGSFFLVPKEFVFEGVGGQSGVLLEVYTENNEKSVQFVPAVPYSENEDCYYLDDSVLRAGMIIDRPNSSDQFTIGDQDELIGVYYINKGYPDFRQVNILYQNEEYAIVEPNSLYGLQEYDYIVLYADSVKMNDYYH